MLTQTLRFCEWIFVNFILSSQKIMDIIYIIIAFIFALIGIIGSVVPVLPGPPLSFVALLLLYFCDREEISTTLLVVMGVIMAIITIFDYVAPAWMTKLKGGSKGASNGALFGIVVGLFMGPWGVIVGPFLGAFIGELMASSSKDKAFNVALMSFYAFLLTSGVKLIYGAVALAMIIYAAIKLIIALF